MPSWESGKSDAVCKLSVLINIFISAELIQRGGWVFLRVTEAVAVLMIEAALLVWAASHTGASHSARGSPEGKWGSWE